MTPSPAPALLCAALAAAERGWPVFPLRPGDKRPAGHPERNCPRTGRCTDGHRTPEQRATLDPEQITVCWQAAPYNVGVATGPAGLLVVDLDIPKDEDGPAPVEWAGATDGLDVFAMVCERAGERLPTETFTVRTRRGGQHLYFTAPAEKQLRGSAGRLGWKVDTRAWGGYVVAAGSRVGVGSYEIVHDAPPAPSPRGSVTSSPRRPHPPRSPWPFSAPGSGRRTGTRRPLSMARSPRSRLLPPEPRTRRSTTPLTPSAGSSPRGPSARPR